MLPIIGVIVAVVVLMAAATALDQLVDERGISLSWISGSLSRLMPASFLVIYLIAAACFVRWWFRRLERAYCDKVWSHAFFWLAVPVLLAILIFATLMLLLALILFAGAVINLAADAP